MNGTAQEVGPASSVFKGTNSITSLTGPWNYMSNPIQWPGEFHIAGHTQKHYGHKVRNITGTKSGTLRALPNIEGDAGMD